jgi:glutamine phosphoribosylpyrophosphate amidotransferase
VAYSLVVSTSRVIGVRDLYGFRPLVLGRSPESGGLNGGLGEGPPPSSSGLMRDVEPGEVVVLEPGHAPRSIRFAEAHHSLCVFELIYFARPDSYMEGRNLYEARRRMGMQLAGSAGRGRHGDAGARHRRPGAPARRGGLPTARMVRTATGRTTIQPSVASART